MKGSYNGSYIRAFKTFPRIQVCTANLSKDGLRRLAWFDFYRTHNQNISLTCRHFGISRDTFYLWKKRFNPRNLQSLEDDKRTRKPHKLREMTTDCRILKRIYEIRLLDTEKSKYEIHEELKREAILVSHNVIQKVINRHSELLNTNHQRKLKQTRRLRIARIKAAIELKEKEPGSLIQVDTKHFFVLGHRFYIFVAVDCKSRFAYTFAYTTISSLSASDFLIRALDAFPFPITAVNTDNGSEYLLNFHKLCEKLSITHYFTHPHSPKMNSRVERLIKTMSYEFLYHQELMPSIDDVRTKCLQFNQKYNRKRLHQALNYKTPYEYVMLYQQQRGESVRYV